MHLILDCPDMGVLRVLFREIASSVKIAVGTTNNMHYRLTTNVVGPEAFSQLLGQRERLIYV